jgi:RNA polymerase sigma-B factor
MTAVAGRRRTPAARITNTDPDRAREARLIAAVREHDDPAALYALVSENLSLVRRIARRHAVYGEQVDDLVQEGMVGLLKAIQRFDPERGVPFPAYASGAVSGEIRHALRDRSSCLRLPEPVQQLRSRLRALADEARAETGSEPGLSDLAAWAGVDDEVAAEAATAGVVPLEVDLPAPESELRRTEARAELDGRLARLDPREREVVYLRFFVDLTQDEIAERLGISQMHVSRILRDALETMGRAAMD